MHGPLQSGYFLQAGAGLPVPTNLALDFIEKSFPLLTVPCRVKTALEAAGIACLSITPACVR